jgi:hypothetical protein
MSKDRKIKMKFSDKLSEIFKILDAKNDYLAYELLYLTDPASEYDNRLKISNVDIGKDYHFKVTINGKEHQIKIGKFVREYIGDLFKGDDITKFSNSYNKLKNNKIDSTKPKLDYIKVSQFAYNPKDPRSTFLSLTTKTYPHGTEEEVLNFLPSLSKDKFGNYYTIIGSNKKPSVMFTSHLDTADRQQMQTKLLSTKDKNGDEIIYTDGSSILGADDKAGVTIMLYMMSHNVPGLYYFFIGEERGGIGSNKLSSDFENHEYLENVKKCISFDRRKTTSVITQQLGRTCCSNEFATALCNEYNKNGLNLSLDTTGIYTDSASFIDDISECTNVSVGYDNEHTTREMQNMTFLIKLCQASVNVNWSELPSVRKVGLNQELLMKYKDLINDIKSTLFELDTRIVGFEDNIYISIGDINGGNISNCYNDIIEVETILNKHNVKNRTVMILDGYINIELK